jgi:hypothetical protein
MPSQIMRKGISLVNPKTQTINVASVKIVHIITLSWDNLFQQTWEDAHARMSLGTLNASGVGTTLKDLNFHNHNNIISIRNVRFTEGILRGLAGHIYNPAQCDLRKNLDMLSLRC